MASFQDKLDAELQRLGPEMAGKTLAEVQAAVSAKVKQVMERCAPMIAATPMAEIIPEIDPADPTRLKLTVLPRPLSVVLDLTKRK
ncbi:MAG TPA: hypothetical protein DCY18_01355 [Thauera sp.]|nr:hypothetical protein [Thauera sp.]HRJ25691.1 hypothetical protein [Thauera sp.]